MTITLSTDQMYEIASAADIDSENVRSDYSGRGMYGKECIGFDLDRNADMLRLGAAIIAVLGEDEGSQVISDVSTDSMGLGMIAYFPSVQCPDWDNSED